MTFFIDSHHSGEALPLKFTDAQAAEGCARRCAPWVLTIAAGVGGFAWAGVDVKQADVVMHLSAAVEKAITTHPEVRARFQDFTSALEGENVSRGGLRPQIAAQSWVGREWRNRMSDGLPNSWNRTGWTLELRQVLFDGGALRNTSTQWGFEKLSRYYDLLETSNNLAHEVVNAYLDVQRYREMQVLATENFKVHEVVLQQLRERQRSGVGRGVDLEQANGRLALAQTNLITETNNLNEVMLRYRRLVGESPATELNAVPDVSASRPSAGALVSFEEALRLNPTLLSKRAMVLAAQAGVKAAKGARAPVVELRATTGRDRNQPGSELRSQQSSQVQLMMSYNFYRGGAEEARIRQTTAQTYAAQDVEAYTCRNVQQNLAINWTGMARVREQLPFLREHEMSTSKVRIAYQQQFQIGQRTLLDMLNTENELFDARRSLTNALYDLKRLEYQWLMLSSNLLPTLGLAQPHSADLPAEHRAVVLPDDVLAGCMGPVPDTQNLAPIVVYGEGDRPPTLQVNDSALLLDAPNGVDGGTEK